ncbi:MAG: hypothetical protein OHK0017_08130 [Patescibacteria group bacterium]
MTFPFEKNSGATIRAKMVMLENKLHQLNVALEQNLSDKQRMKYKQQKLDAEKQLNQLDSALQALNLQFQAQRLSTVKVVKYAAHN